MSLRAVSATEFARRWGEVMDAVRGGTHVLVMHHTRPQAVLMPWAQYDALMRDAEIVALRSGDREQPSESEERAE